MNESHPLAPLLSPGSVAIFGASNDPGRISGRSLRYYKEAGYRGALYPINPNRAVVQGIRAYSDLDSVSGPIEFALIAVPASQAVAALEAAARKGVRGAVMFTAGFAETGAEGRAMQERIAAIAQAGGIRLCGPNCLGLFNLRLGHTPTFCSYLEAGPQSPGPLGMVTQSGAFGTHLLALARRRGIGVGIWVSTGNEADIQVADGISFLADDPETEAIACYMEAIKDRDRFAAAVARARANGKPVIAIKVGGSAIGAAAAVSHTASLAGSDAIYDAALRQWGVERARTPEDLVEIAYACTRGRLPRSRRLAVMTISGHRRGILRHDRIGGQQRDPFGDRLRHEEAIESVLVNRRQYPDGNDMLAGDRELIVAVGQQPAPQQPRIDPEILAPERILDDDFPQACRAEQQFVLRVPDQRACAHR
jgi:acyl-CoA synthetase (NDP forming)